MNPSQSYEPSVTNSLLNKKKVDQKTDSSMYDIKKEIKSEPKTEIDDYFLAESYSNQITRNPFDGLVDNDDNMDPRIDPNIRQQLNDHHDRLLQLKTLVTQQMGRIKYALDPKRKRKVEVIPALHIQEFFTRIEWEERIPGNRANLNPNHPNLPGANAVAFRQDPAAYDFGFDVDLEEYLE